MTKHENVIYRAADHAVIGEHRIDVTNWSHLGQPPKVEINWPGIGSVDIETARRFVADLETAIAVASRFETLNKTA